MTEIIYAHGFAKLEAIDDEIIVQLASEKYELLSRIKLYDFIRVCYLGTPVSRTRTSRKTALLRLFSGQSIVIESSDTGVEGSFLFQKLEACCTKLLEHVLTRNFSLTPFDTSGRRRRVTCSSCTREIPQGTSKGFRFPASQKSSTFAQDIFEQYFHGLGFDAFESIISAAYTMELAEALLDESLKDLQEIPF